MSLLIRPLGTSPHLTVVAGWLHAQWWQASGWSLPATTDWLVAALGPAAPLTLEHDPSTWTDLVL